MAREIKSQLIGVDEFREVLRLLPPELAKNTLSSGARAGANALRRRAYADLSVAMTTRSAVEDDIAIRKKRTPRDEISATYAVGPPTRKPELRWLHDGTQPHKISAVDYIRTSTSSRHKARAIINQNRGNGRGNVLSDGTTFFGQSVTHPGQPPRPWLFAALFRSREGMMKAIGDSVRKSLPKQVRKVRTAAYGTRQLRGIGRNIGRAL